MINGIVLVVIFYAGFAFGCWANRKPPVIRDVQLTVDQSLVDKTNAAWVEAWLNDRGLVWQPKGAAFNFPSPASGRGGRGEGR